MQVYIETDKTTLCETDLRKNEFTSNYQMNCGWNCITGNVKRVLWNVKSDGADNEQI
jgi:hypothetical protein